MAKLRLAGLPPLLVQAGSRETMVDQIRAFATRTRDAGTALTFSEYPDMVHVWHQFRGATPDAARAIAEAGAFIRKHTGVRPGLRREGHAPFVLDRNKGTDTPSGTGGAPHDACFPSEPHDGPIKEKAAMNSQAISQEQTPTPSLAPRFESIGVTFPEGYRREQSAVFARNELFVPAP